MSNGRPPTPTIAALLVVLSGASFILGRLGPFQAIPFSGYPVERRRIHDPRPTHDAVRNDIVADLMERGAEIIPLEPVLGGTMGFYNAQDIHILNDRWVYALFEDGHYGGYILLEYTRNADGSLDWSVIAVEPF